MSLFFVFRGLFVLSTFVHLCALITFHYVFYVTRLRLGLDC